MHYINHMIRHSIGFLFIFGLRFSGYSQQPAIADSFTAVENNAAFTNAQKLDHLYQLKKKAEQQKAVGDTVYARIMSRIGLYEYTENKNFDAALHYTLLAAKVNMAIKPRAAFFLAVGDYFNLGFYYDKTQQFSKALAYYDTAILLSQKVAGREGRMLDARLGRIYIYFRIGDYQKSIEESTRGVITSLQLGDSTRLMDFLNQRGQSYFFQNQLQQSLSDIETVIPIAERFGQPYRLASAYKMKGFINAKNRNFKIAEAAFNTAIKARKQTKDDGQVAGDFNDFGNFYLDSLNNYRQAKIYYAYAINYAGKAKDSVRLSRVCSNMARAYLAEEDLQGALHYIQLATAYLRLPVEDNFYINPTAVSMRVIGNKELLLYIFGLKTEVLLRLYKNKKSRSDIGFAIQTALLTDSIITQMRHEQVREQSKLYWRDRTRRFFGNAIEACYLADDFLHAFYFMEKSRSVLLNDKLNELGASAHLPPDEEKVEHDFKVRISLEEQKLGELEMHSRQYLQQQLNLLKIKDGFEAYIKKIEEKYPGYYQYKYADDVPTLNRLQDYLLNNEESFIYYFVEDSVAFMLAVLPDTVVMVKHQSPDVATDQVAAFLHWCSNKQQLNNHYDGFSFLSHSLYQKFFEPLRIPPGRVILCLDNFFLPFEALCTDKKGTGFLIYDYIFSYVYSAGYLFKKIDAQAAKGKFVGFSPVKFQPYLGLPELKFSAQYLQKAASHYDETLLFTNSEASKQNFLHALPRYSIAHVYSHALADTANSEPLLYLQDSVIHLSELQLLNRPATRLIMLSACQTNVGKSAAGEGVYSLARGFSTAGIPAVAATLWQADETTIYEVSDKFHEYLATGIRKDEALRKAKLYVMQHGKKEQQLPFFWANMVLLGNADPILFSNHPTISWWWLLMAIPLLAGIIYMLAFKTRKKIAQG